VRDAILREVARGGQVYFLYNRVATIDRFAARLRALVPEARIGVAHGQMREHALEDIMMDFYDGRYDVLLCTTIIESGLDVQSANTLIVFDADRFGLAQLYQLRGRVGRSNRLAYAYFTVRENKVLTETADKRLLAIREFTEFGSGFRIAMRDLEIRGAGNLLGSEQHGHMATVGYDLYVKMIEETVREVRGELHLADVETRIELPVNAYLPTEYVGSDVQRIDAYKRIAMIRDRASREDTLEELVDRFGEPKAPVVALVNIAHLKGLAGRLFIEQVSLKNGNIQMRFSPRAQFDLMKLVTAMEPFGREVMLSATQPPSLILRIKAEDVEGMLPRGIEVMEALVAGVFEVGE